MRLLDRILESIARHRPLESARLADLSLRSAFAVARLADGSIGSAANFDAEPSASVRFLPLVPAIEQTLRESLSGDPALLGVTGEAAAPYLRALRVAIISALSQALLTSECLRPYGLAVAQEPDFGARIAGLVRPGDVVTVIGFGGPWSGLLKTRAAAVQICDFSLSQPRKASRVAAAIAVRRARTGFAGEVLLSGGEDAGELLARSTVVSITGSALCNDTMEGLLRDSCRCREVIIQGPSASVFPVELFARRATRLFTTRKSPIELAMARQGGSTIFEVVDRDYIRIERSDP